MATLQISWFKLRKPLAATLAIVIATICTLIAAYYELVTVDPGNLVFMTVLLVDLGSAETFYVTAFFRIIGVLLGLGVGAGISFISNALRASDVSYVEINTFRVSMLAIVIFIPLMVDVTYPKYSYASIMFVYTVTSLIFSGLSNADTIATIVALVGGIVIAFVIMLIFGYESAEALLLSDHQKLISKVCLMMKISVRANPTFRDEYFKTLDETKQSFSTNIDSINNYERWMRWTRRIPPFNFVLLTQSLRPLYHQTASLFWSLCRDRLISAGPTTDPIHLYCSTAELYFDHYHQFVVAIVESIENMEKRFGQIFETHPSHILQKILKHGKTISLSVKQRVRSLSSSSSPHHSHKHGPSLIINRILHEDIEAGFLKNWSSMKMTFYEHRLTSHSQFSQRWLMSDYMYQLLVVLVELLDYLGVVTDTVVRNDDKHRRAIHRRIRKFLIFIESLTRDGFFRGLRDDDDADNGDGSNQPQPMRPILGTQSLEFDDEEEESNLAEDEEDEKKIRDEIINQQFSTNYD
jgi:hypothetical protein